MSEITELQEQIDFTAKKDLVETHIRLLGDSTTISEVIQLLAYIRHALKYNLDTHIDVQIGKYVANADFVMDVNGQEISDLITQPIAVIN